MVRGIVALLSVSGFFWGITTIVVMQRGWTAVYVVHLTALLSILPGLLTLGLMELTRKRSQMERTVLAMTAGFVRLFFAVGVGGVIYYLDSSLRGSELALLILGTVFYIIVLATETLWVYRREMERV